MAAVAGRSRTQDLDGRAGGLAGRFAAVPYHWQALVVIVMGSFMVILDTTIVNVALPRIIQVFDSNVNQGQLILTGYMVALAVVMPATGYCSDTFGAKRTYLVVVALFTIGSALCGLAPSMEGLVLFRVLQGLGGGMVMPLGMSILFQTTPPSERGTVMGIFGLPILVAPIIGPSLGGYLVEYVDWRPIFTLNIPIGILAVFLGAAILRETPHRGATRFDWPGFILASIGFSAAMVALEKAPVDGWAAPDVVVLLMVAAVAIPCWIVVELASDQPLLDLSVLGDRTFLVASLVTFVAMVAMFSSLFLLPLFLQNVRGLSALETGLLLMPQGIAAAVTMPIAGRLLDRFGPKRLIIPGILSLAFATWLLTGLDIGTSDNTIRLALAIRGVAMGLMMMPALTVAMDTIPPHQIARATALSNVLRQVFGAFGAGAFASVLLDRQHFHRATLAQSVTSDNQTSPEPP
ncbi:MAG: DHA2 family efflux MFS transporter permease subunit [Chloroflexota bacterium]|nr:DHA2 family efflux MFS transporter permease subunit [Chloroflexota bacterium]